MQRGTALTRDEVSRIFQLAPHIVDALIEEGVLLCQVRKGEQLIPLSQLESFFRDGLVRLYRAEATLDQQPPRVSQTEAETAPASPREGDSSTAPAMTHPKPVPAPQWSAGARGTRIEPAEGDGAAPKAAATAAPVAPQPTAPAPQQPPPPPAREQEVIDSPELRLAPRYIPRRQIGGNFNDIKFTLVQVSSTGMRIRHNEPLVPGDEAKLSFALMNPARSFVMRARVVWTSVAHYEADSATKFYISGLRVTEHADRLARAIEILRAQHDLQPERREKPRPGAVEVETAQLDGVSDDEIAMVMSAMQKFATDPQEASRWYSRAKFALADEHVRREAPPRPTDREEVLGIWEYLERQIEIAKITGVLTWMRRQRRADAH